MTQTVTRWWLVRHAPVIGVNGRVYGQDDIESDCTDEAEFKHLAGLLPHDLIVLFEGEPVRGVDDLWRRLTAETIGRVVSVTVVRGPEMRSVRVVPVESVARAA